MENGFGIRYASDTRVTRIYVDESARAVYGVTPLGELVGLARVVSQAQHPGRKPGQATQAAPMNGTRPGRKRGRKPKSAQLVTAPAQVQPTETPVAPQPPVFNPAEEFLIS